MTLKKHRIAQAACLLAACMLLRPMPFWTGASKLVVQMSPLVAICHAVALRAIDFTVAAGLVVAAVGIFRRRWFCKYACPVGLILDAITVIGLKKTRWWTRWPPLGKYFAILTIAGSVVGYPLLLWMDPLAIFSNSVTVTTAGSIVSAAVAILGIAALILLSISSGSVWCARICPLGGTLDLLASVKARLTSRPKAAPAQNMNPNPNYGLLLASRRFFVLSALGIAMGLAARRVGAARGEDAPLRPPGASPETLFAGLCLRCGNCIRSCPEKIIYSDLGQAGVAGLLAPVVRYEKKYCREGCTVCTELCPSGALQPLNVKEKQRYIIGEALLDIELCVLALGQRDCDACARACPYDAVHIFWDEDQYIAYPVVDFKKCNGCGACEVACPVSGYKAIRVWRKA